MLISRPDFKNFSRQVVQWIAIAVVLGGIELVYNVYPPRAWASAFLFVEHAGIVIWLIYSGIKVQ
jgi:hypothetical protein